MINVLFLSLALSFSTFSKHSSAETELSVPAVHETWRIAFSCKGEKCKADNACELKPSDISQEQSETNSAGITCLCPCKKNSLDISSTLPGNENPEHVKAAMAVVAKKMNWKMLNMEMNQRFPEKSFKVNYIEAALNHGVTYIYFTCKVEGEDQDLIITVTDRS